MNGLHPIMEQYQRELQESTKKRNEIWKESNDLFIKFYYQIVLLSGGSIALSVTYLGYLQSIPNNKIKIIAVLMASWVCFIISIISSLYRNYHYGKFMYHLGSAEWYEKMEKLRALLEGYIQNLKPSSEDVKQVSSAVEKEKGNSERYFRRLGYVTQISFFVALSSLVMFAICNTLSGRIPSAG